MKLIGVVRLGRDAEVRYAPSGDPVASFSGAYNYGRKDGDGKRPTQWVELTLWGSRAEKLGGHLKKGAQLFVVASDVHIETYAKRDGSPGWKFTARVDDIEFVGARQDGEQREEVPAPRAAAPVQRPAAKPASGTGFDDMDDDIPF
jgi:single-strand DNA-binding protein